MSQHPSLRSDKTGGHYRNVLKRWEKIKHLLEEDKWNEEENSVFHLPKIKRIKIKFKKKKPVPEEKEKVGKLEEGKEEVEQVKPEKKRETEEKVEPGE